MSESNGSAGSEGEETPDRRSVTVPLPSGRGLVIGAVGLLIVALFAAVVVEAVRLHHRSHDDRTGMSSLQQSALAAAKTYAVQFATYNYKDFDSQVALTESHSVDPFLSQYKSRAAPLRSDIVKVKAQSSGQVVSAGVASISSTSALVDLFLNQTISNDASKTPRVESERVEMTLARRGNQWFISKVLLP